MTIRADICEQSISQHAGYPGFGEAVYMLHVSPRTDVPSFVLQQLADWVLARWK